MCHRLVFPKEIALGVHCVTKREWCRPPKGAISEVGIGRRDSRDNCENYKRKWLASALLTVKLSKQG